MRLLAIDFGTSNTVAALLVDGQAPRTVTFDTSPLLPSAVFVAADGQVAVGREAQRLARLDPSRYEPNPKRRIDDGDVLLGDRVLPVVAVIAAVLRVVGIEVRRQLGGALPDEIRLTHPAQWGATRQNVLVSAARAAGLGANLVLLPEPVAAAAQYTRLPGRTLPPGGAVAVYDLGGGTLDIAVVGRNRTAGQPLGPFGAPGVPGLPGQGPHRTEPGGEEGAFYVLAEAGLPDLGGLDFDQAVLEHVGREPAATDPVRWQQILRPVDTSTRRAARTLAEDVRAAKEALSRYPQTEVSLPDPFVDALLTRKEFENLIRPDLLRSIDVLSGTLRSAGVAPEQLSGIFLVGGSSRIPLVAALIQERLQVIPVALDQPETAVALGALLVPVRREGNRTTGLAESPPGAGPAFAQGGAAFPGLPLPAGPTPSTGHPAARPPTVGHLAGPPVTVARSRRRVLVAAGLALVVVLGVVLFLVRPFSPAATAGGGPATGITGASGSSSGSSSTGVSGTASSTGSRSAALGPGGLFTAGEVDFLSDNVNGLGNCTNFTATFNGVVAAPLAARRAVRCSIGDAEAGKVSAPALLYVLTVGDAQTDGYLAQVVKNRKADKSGLSKSDTDDAFASSTEKGRVVTAYDLPALGKATYDPTRGASVLAWTIDGRPYVGLVVSLGTSLQSDLTDYWAANFKPRG